MKKTLLITLFAVAAGNTGMIATANAQTAGSAINARAMAVEASQLTLGWSVNKNILGKTVYNETGAKIGKVDDVIIAADKSVAYLIIGAGGFIGIGRHDVAIAMTKIVELDGKLVMSGATKDSLKAMPKFDYSSDTTAYDQFVAKSEQEIAKAKEKSIEMQNKAASLKGDAKVKMDQQLLVLQRDMKAAEDKLAEMKHAGAKKWKEFDNDINKAMERVKHALENADK